MTLKDVNSEPVVGVVETLEDALALAKAGQLRSVAVVGSMVGHRSLTAHSGDDYIVLLGHLSLLNGTLVNKLTAESNTRPEP